MRFIHVPLQVLKRFYEIAGLYFYDQYTAVLKSIDDSWGELSSYPELLPELLRMRGYCFFQLGHLSESLKALNEVRRLQPDNVENLEKIKIAKNKAITELDALYGEKKFQQVMELSEALLETDPSLQRVKFFRGVAFDEMAQYSAAENIFNELIAVNPLEEQARRSLALVLRHQNKIGDAMKVVDAGIEMLGRHGRDTSDLQQLHSWLMSESGFAINVSPVEEYGAN